ncbi:MAG: hypothetical protein ABFD07_10850, partial [Methanobacterium sp.]
LYVRRILCYTLNTGLGKYFNYCHSTSFIVFKIDSLFTTNAYSDAQDIPSRILSTQALSAALSNTCLHASFMMSVISSVAARSSIKSAILS